jgi:trk system potassium uptake protein
MSRRHRQHLAARYRLMLETLGPLAGIIGLTILSPVLLVPFYPEEAALSSHFLIVGLPILLFAAGMYWRYRPRSTSSLKQHEGMIVIFLAWLLASMLSAIPLASLLDLAPSSALFESVSGWTTTGLSMVDVDETPRLVLFYRSMLQFSGGVGFAILGLTFLALSAGGGLSMAEGRDERLVPNIRRSAAIVGEIYLTYTVVGTVALRLAGMTWFDALNHAICAISTGGFSTQAASIGHYDSAIIEAVIMVLMLLGALNFVTAWTLIRRQPEPVIHNGEIRLGGFLLVVVIPALFLLLAGATLYASVGETLRVTVFEAISALSSTGYTVTSYNPWPSAGLLLLIILMIIGGGHGSTAGGLKLSRAHIVFQSIRWEVRRTLLPRHAVNEPAIWLGSQQRFLSDHMVRRTTLFVGIYVTAIFIGAVIVAAHGHSIGDSLFEITSAVGTVGLSVGLTGPEAPVTLQLTLMVAMFLGRLEFFVVFIAVTRLYGDARSLFDHRRDQSASSKTGKISSNDIEREER